MWVLPKCDDCDDKDLCIVQNCVIPRNSCIGDWSCSVDWSLCWSSDWRKCYICLTFIGRSYRTLLVVQIVFINIHLCT